MVKELIKLWKYQPWLSLKTTTVVGSGEERSESSRLTVVFPLFVVYWTGPGKSIVLWFQNYIVLRFRDAVLFTWVLGKDFLETL